MALKDSLSKLDRALDRRLDGLPDVSSKTDRERYRGAVKTGVTQAGRRAAVRLKSLDDMGDKAVGRLRPQKGGWNRIIDYTTEHSVTTFVMVLIVTGLIATQALNIPKYMRGDMEIYLPPDNEATIILQEVRQDFSTDIIVIYVKGIDYNGQPLNLTDLRALLEMSHFEGDDTNRYAADEMDRGIDPVKGDRGMDDRIEYTLSIATLIKEFNSTPERIAASVAGQSPPEGSYAIPPDQARIDQIVNAIPYDTLSNMLKDTDGDGVYDRAAIIIGVKSGTPPAEIVGKVDRMLKHLHPAFSRMVNTGPMTVIEKIQGRTIYEFIKVMPFVLLYLFLTMYFFHRTFVAPLVGLTPVGLGIIITFGIVGALKDFLIISPQIALIAPVTLGLGTSFCHYILNRYNEEKKGTPLEKARVAARAMGLPIIISAVATAIGFSSLMVGTLPPIAAMGFALAIGILLTSTLMMLLLPGLIVTFKYKKRMEFAGWRKFASMPSDHRKKTLVIFIALVTVSVALIPLVKFNADYMAMAPQDDPAFTNMNEYSKAMGGGYVGMVIVRGSPESGSYSGMARDVDVLVSIDSMETEMATAPFSKCIGVVDIMKLVKVPETITLPPPFPNMTVHFPVGFSFWDAVTNSSITYVQKYLIDIFYRSLSPMMVSFLVSDSFDKTLVYVFQPSMDIELSRKAVNGVNKAVDDSNIPRARASHLTGVAAIQLAVNDLLISGTLISLAVCTFFTWLVLVVVFRSWRLAFFTLIPCLVVIGLEPMILVGLNIPLSVVTVMIGSIAIGTGVDFSIQITQRIRKSGINTDSVKDTVEHMGISFVEATSTVVFGFMAVLYSPGFMVDMAMGAPYTITAGVPIQSIREFITMINILLILNALASIFILPAIYTVWLRWRQSEKLRREKEGWQE
jgi:predicted RND superfamily exporter protein